jgi:hypothetical protein
MDEVGPHTPDPQAAMEEPSATYDRKRSCYPVAQMKLDIVPLYPVHFEHWKANDKTDHERRNPNFNSF